MYGSEKDMVSDDTYKARTAAHLYEEAAYLPYWVAVTKVVDAIADPAEQGSAESAIERTALDNLSPVVFTPGTGQSALSLERGDRGTVDARVKDWIERHDPDALPFGL